MIYNKKIADRLRKVMEHSGLETSGLSILIGIGVSHINSILAHPYRRRLTEDIASKIGKKMGFDGNILLDTTKPIPKEEIENSFVLKEFKLANINEDKYFLNTKNDRSIKSFIEDKLLKSKFLEGEPKYLREIRKFCKTQFNKLYTSGELAQGLSNIVKMHEENSKLDKPLKIKKVLKTHKEPIKKKDGTLGERMVDVFYLVENKKETAENKEV